LKRVVKATSERVDLRAFHNSESFPQR
jgi:hypothetical protein